MKKVKDWKETVLLYGALTVLLFFAVLFLGSHFPVVHNSAVIGNSNYPESYTVQISPAFAFKSSWNFGRELGIIVWFGTGILLLLAANDVLGGGETATKPTVGGFISKGSILVTLVGWLLTLALVFGPHSKLVNKVVTVDKDRYEKNIQGNQDSLKSLFK